MIFFMLLNKSWNIFVLAKATTINPLKITVTIPAFTITPIQPEIATRSITKPDMTVIKAKRHK